MNHKIRILAIAPYEALKDTMVRIVNERSDIDMSIEVGVITEGAHIVSQYNQHDFDAIISRGGTKMEIEKIAEIPVFEVPISYLDLLGIVKLVEYYAGKIAILAYANIAKSARLLCEIFHYDYNISVIDVSHNAKEKVLELKDEGYTLIIGDAVSVKYAEEYGLQSILLTSGPDSVKETFDMVVNVCTYYGTLHKKARFMDAFLRSQGEYLLVMNDKNEVIHHTLPILPKQLPRYCRNMIPALQAGTSASAHKKVQRHMYSIRGCKHRITGHTYYLYGITQTEHHTPHLSGKKNITIYNREDFQNSYSTFLYTIQTGNPEFWNRAMKLAASKDPVVIFGETGTEYDKMAIYLYQKSFYSNHPIYIINCPHLTEEEMDYLLTDLHSPLHTSNSTLFFRNIDGLSQSLIDDCLDGLNSFSAASRNRFLFSFERKDQDENRKKEAELFKRISPLEIEMIPLRNRTSQLPNIIVKLIQEYNMDHETHIIGLDPEALELIQSYAWPQNSLQLHRVMNEAFLDTNIPWVSARTIRQLLIKEKMKTPSVNINQVNLDQTLDQIIQEVALKILAKENMNQSKAAKRLGISRTTLWRILKKAENK